MSVVRSGSSSESLLEDRTGAAIEGRGWTDGVPVPYVIAEMVWAALYTACLVAIEGCTPDADESYRMTLFFALFHIVGLPGVMITAVSGGPRALLILMNYMAVVADVQNTMRIFQRLVYYGGRGGCCWCCSWRRCASAPPPLCGTSTRWSASTRCARRSPYSFGAR